MKKLLLFSFTVFLALASCQTEEQNEEQNETAFIGQHAILKGLAQSDVPDIELNMHLANGLLPEVFLGDTVSYQYYVNGEKHGPYFSVFSKYFNDPSYMDHADGMYRQGEKHGYFMRYHMPQDPSYIAYYQNGEYMWGDYYSNYGMEGIHPRFPMKVSDEELVINAKHPNGRTWFKGKYKNGEPVGVHKIYWQNGHKFGEVNYSKMTVTEIYPYEEGPEKHTWTFEKDWKEGWW